MVGGTDRWQLIANFLLAERAYKQLSNLSITIIPDEINLTRRVLEPMHRFHKLAADVMLTDDFFDN
jgi:hypothetical protein